VPDAKITVVDAPVAPDAKVTPDAGEDASPPDASPPDARPTPLVVIDKPADNSVTGTSVMATFTAMNAASATCTLDGNAIDCTLDGVELAGLGGGSHTLTAQGHGEGLDGPISTVTWAVDALGPAVSITSPLNGGFVTSTTPDLLFDPADAVSVSCTLDSATVACDLAGSATSTVLSQGGPHTFTVAAADEFGNIGSATVVFSVDSIGPSVFINNPADGALVCPNPVPDVSVGEAGATLQCTLDDIPQACDMALEANFGTHSFTAVATDIHGNEGTLAMSFFKIDSILDAGPVREGANPGDPCGFTWTIAIFSDDNPSDVMLTCTYDGGAPFPCQVGDEIFSNQGEQFTNTLRVQGIDKCGNESDQTDTCSNIIP
jgi:hypothetical protein